MPVGIKRKRIIAVKSKATSPNVGPVTYDITPFTLPSSIDAEVVPASMAEPPEITVMKAFPM
jgi:hypothetical protein